MKKIFTFFMLTFFALNSSYAMQESTKKNKEKEKTVIKLKIKVDPKKALEMGQKYYTQKNYDLAFQYFKYAAKRDFTEAQLEYATMLFDGLGCEKQLEKALEIVNIIMKKTSSKKDDDIDSKNINRVAKTLWHEIVTKLILELMEPMEIPEGGLLSLLGLNRDGGDEEDEKEPEMSEAVRSMFV